MSASVDHRVSAIATPQHGAITRAQLRAAGLSDGAIANRIRAGRLHRVHRGVFVVGHRALSSRTQWMAAVLAGGEDAVLDLHAAAELHGIARPSWKYRRRPVAVLCIKQRRPARGITYGRTHQLPPEQRTEVDGIPVVTIERLIANLGALESATTICKLLDEAAYHDAVDVDELQRIAELRRCHPAGIHALADGIEQYLDGERGTDSELEELALQFCRDSGVPDPACNRYLHADGERFRADQCWEQLRVVQEVNGSGHARPTRRRLDRRRRRAFRADDWKYLVVTRHDLTDPAARHLAANRLRRAHSLLPLPTS